MKKIALVLATLSFSALAYAGDTYVNGYWRDTNHDGIKDTYVQPYHRTTPDNNTLNNYSTQGNINPWTGNSGAVNPYPTLQDNSSLYQAPRQQHRKSPWDW